MGLLSRLVLGVAAVAVLWSAACSAGGPGQSPQTVDPVVVATTGSSEVLSTSGGVVTASASATVTRSSGSTTSAGAVVTTTAVTGPSPSATPTATTAAVPVMTYSMTGVSGPMTRVTREDGAVFIIPADVTITQSPSMVVSVTVPASVPTKGVDIAGAKAAYYGWLDFGDRALQEPGRDWSAEAAKWAMEPHLSLILHELEEAASRHSRVEGHGSFFATVSQASPGTVQMTVCGDASGLDVVDDRTGKSIRANDGFRHIQYVTITRGSSGKWLISNIDGSAGETC